MRQIFLLLLLWPLDRGCWGGWGPHEALEQHHEDRRASAIDILQQYHERGNLRRGSVPLPHAPDDVHLPAEVAAAIASHSDRHNDDGGGGGSSGGGVGGRSTVAPVSVVEEPSAEALEQSLTRRAGVRVTADVRGNLGPPSVVCQIKPGADWLKDRWQAASDMGGTAIPGRHWLVVDLGRPVVADRAVLDWEAAFASKYRIEVRSTAPLGLDDDGSGGEEPSATAGGGGGEGGGGWRVLFDASRGDASAAVRGGRRRTHERGRSPGVKPKQVTGGKPGGVPLHVVHTVLLVEDDQGYDAASPVVTEPFQYLRVVVLKPAMGWGVSLWQLDLVGFDVT